MANLKILNEMATKLANSFMSATNIDSIKNLPADEVRIDLLSEKIGPTIESRELALSMMRYHSWFNEEIKHLDIGQTKVTKVTINLKRTPEGRSISYVCFVEIETADRKKYSAKKTFTWNL